MTETVHTPEQKAAFVLLREKIKSLSALQKEHKAIYHQNQSLPEFPAAQEAFREKHGVQATWTTRPLKLVKPVLHRAWEITILLDLRRCAVGKEPCHGSCLDRIREAAATENLTCLLPAEPAQVTCEAPAA